MNIEQRKKDHVRLSASGEAAYVKTAGFERYDFNHNALPEVDFNEIDTFVNFLGYKADFPLFISSMTGGYVEAGKVNQIIAGFCQEEQIPFGVGSQRIMLEQPETSKSFSIVRKEAPDACIASNIGGCQLIGGLNTSQLKLLTDTIEANAIIVHLNVLQELMQSEGDRQFRGILQGITDLISNTDLPVIVKETGAGIDGRIARQLIDCGVSVIDVSGSGGTSWSKIENQRRNLHGSAFDEWGIPTVDCILSAREKGVPKEGLIASGGVRTVSEMGKALCLGAGFTAMAQPVIRQINEGGRDALQSWYETLKHEFKVMLCLLGCRSVSELGESHLRNVDYFSK